ncbi:MAG: hypothetical protein SW019_26240, partial [Actinomycetota bacterium]|nr:hypothetical protein [Actinomycetota bacterium]
VNGINAPAAATTDTLDDQHAFLYNALPVITQIPLVDLLVQISPTGQQLLDFATSPLSGVLLGIAGPVVGPAVVLAANLQSAIDDFTADTPDPARALNTLLNTPAQMTDAFLNGGVHMDVTSLVEALGPSIGVTFPEGTKIGIAFGGLLSPGGSAFNALDMDYDRDILGLPIIRFNLATGQGPGFFGSLIDMNQAIARAIGWDGGGNPLAPAEEPSARNSLAPDDEVAAAASSTTLATPETPSGQDEAAAPASGAAAPDAPTDAVDPTDGAGESAVETATSDYHGRHRKEDVEWVADQLDSTTEDLDGENTAGAVALQDDEPDMSEDVEPADDAEVVEDSAADGGLDTVAQADDDETSGNHEDAEGADESDAAPGADDTSGDGGQSAGSGSTRAAA